MPRTSAPVRIRLSDERRAVLTDSIRGFCVEQFDLGLSEFQAQGLVDFLLRELGGPVYNQAIQDARAYIQEKLTDLEGELYEPED